MIFKVPGQSNRVPLQHRKGFGDFKTQILDKGAIMEKAKQIEKALSRRRFLSGAGILAAGGALGVETNLAFGTTPTPGAAPPLPWKWEQLDPMEAGSLAYRYYFDIGG
jgi:hypothetical protein